MSPNFGWNVRAQPAAHHRSPAHYRLVATLDDGLGEHRVCRREAVDLAGGTPSWGGAGGDTVSMAGSETVALNRAVRSRVPPLKRRIALNPEVL